MFVFGGPLRGSTGVFLCELIAIFFVSSQYVYEFDCFLLMIYWIHLSKEASTRA